MTPKEIVVAASQGKIGIREAEWRLRGAFGSGETKSAYQEIYNYLDEVAGMIDAGEETLAHRTQFTEYLASVGFPEKFSEL
jgi:hypothetical protein